MALDALREALAGKKKLFRVSCQRPKESLTNEERDRLWDSPRAYVAGTSIENATLKAIQYFNKVHGVSDYDVHEVSVFASGDDEKEVFIE